MLPTGNQKCNVLGFVPTGSWRLKLLNISDLLRQDPSVMVAVTASLRGGCYLRWVEVQRALHAGGHAGENHPRVALEALRATIHQRDHAALIQAPVLIAQQTHLQSNTCG